MTTRGRFSLSFLVAVVAVGAGNVAFAQSRCDSMITKAAGKNVACEASVIAEAQKTGTAFDGGKLARCEAKFATACSNGHAAGDCVVQLGSCGSIETAANACVTTLMGNPPPTTTTTTTTMPSNCPYEQAPCGSCGSGVCVFHCPGTELICLNNLGPGGGACTSDADCPSGQRCGGGVGTNCGSGLCGTPCP